MHCSVSQLKAACELTTTSMNNKAREELHIKECLGINWSHFATLFWFGYENI